MPRSLPLALTLLSLAACGKSGDGTEPTPPPASSAGEPASPEPTPAPAPEPAPAPAPALEFDEVVYRFQDASVPPPDHRSVTITVKGGSILRVVDSYGDELERAEGTLGEGGLDKLGKLLADGKVGNKPQEEGVATAQCTGGTSETVTLRQAGKEVFVGTLDHCGGGDTPDFEGDLKPFIAALKALASAGPTKE